MEEDVSEVENNDHEHDKTKETPHNEEEKYKHKFSDDPERKQILFSLVADDILKKLMLSIEQNGVLFFFRIFNDPAELVSLAIYNLDK